jgi:amino acid permease
MNESEMNSPAPAELSDQIAALRCQVFTLLLALVVVSGTLATYLCFQSRVIGKDIMANKPQATQIIQAFSQSRPKLESFVNQLIAYGQTHPEFQQQVLDKYNIKPAPKK